MIDQHLERLELDAERPEPQAADGIGKLTMTDRSRGAVVLAICVGWFVAILYVFSAATKTNVVQPPFMERVRPYVGTVLPEGWGFFTRNPREADTALYQRGDDRIWRSSMRSPTTGLGQLFGWNRTFRAQGPELAFIARAVPVDGWTDCGVDDVSECIDRLGDASPRVSTSAATTVQTVCGDVALVRTAPPPWSWWVEDRDVVSTVEVAKVRVTCEN